MASCSKCDFTYDPAMVPGGLCPRCLLLGMHDSRFESPPESIESTAANQSTSGLATTLEDDELAAELPNFELVERLGKGGMGVVWKARERVLNRHVAIKLLHNVKNDAAFVERFTREACVMAQLNHPNIVTLYSFGRTRSNHCYLVMEMVDGADLADLMAHHRLDVPTALTIVHDICAALSHAHDAGFVHRDIKPGNVLIDRHGRIKVADFGLARLTRMSDKDTLAITKQGWAVGTPHYTAPEQANGRGDED
ncbi:MAG TPA: serine/threonine-protein kinase, partial [Candidatus Saccharimonadia bacterium]|nr:serine/threonine-protein kinase [Candidatus Saccharimonadia bacterium]